VLLELIEVISLIVHVMLDTMMMVLYAKLVIIHNVPHVVLLQLVSLFVMLIVLLVILLEVVLLALTVNT